ncbi:hypothetical protein [Yimella sp. cx-51]|uniref:hypothetical protein n=1 Tax=Yimella sp. cx-51 TaxID=2770551 RepID=UPI001FCA50E3|nr:hypothetical protein [Yimella sp. cx-51]
MDQAYDRLAEGFVAAGRIAWHPEPAVEEAMPSRWINVVFLQGDEADRPLRILGELGHVAGEPGEPFNAFFNPEWQTRAVHYKERTAESGPQTADVGG